MPGIIEKYNNIIHGTTGFKPTEINSKNEKNVLLNSFTFKKTLDLKHRKFKENHFVRISKQLTNPTTYLLKDGNNGDIKGSFNSEELQKVKHPVAYLVEKILRKKGYITIRGF